MSGHDWEQEAMRLDGELRDARRERDAERAHADRLAECLRDCRYSCQTQDDCAKLPRPCETCRLNREIDPLLAAHDARRKGESHE